ncbi:MAG: AAA family ATPase, partial [Spirochaetales bacterium]|nr:AAA family ATPase [Spirochaetales bacterium]
GFSKPFVVKNINGINYLFADKYYTAKISIENRIGKLFPGLKQWKNYEADKSNLIKKFEENTFSKKTNSGIKINSKQADAILLGQNANLVLTGGPGTGKTTAICFLLWTLMQNNDSDGMSYCDYELFLAAPSGKAAERMKESISGSLSAFKPEFLKKNPEIEEKLTCTDSMTIHRLLSYNPGTNGFYYNSENQFDKKSIFIIDEASMIDIHLFKCLLEAIPDEARVFILGDKDQLPSVAAGAVLGEILAQKKDSVVELTETKRFDINSQVGELMKELQCDSEFPEDMAKYGKWLAEADEFQFSRNDELKTNPVFFYSIKEPDSASEKNVLKKSDQVKVIADKWSKTFCEDLTKVSSLPVRSEISVVQLKSLWGLANEAKILCAEREGIRGVKNINEVISKKVCEANSIKMDADGYFAGQLLILTKNQKMFRLYNGDTGIVVTIGDEGLKYIMVEKKSMDKNDSENETNEDSTIFRIGDFIFYPINLLPKDSLETAYAITIHKSQGSGYKNIMIFLPEQEGHPLLNRQIVYTAVTRTEGNTYLVATKTSLNYAKRTLISRDTMIQLCVETA